VLRHGIVDGHGILQTVRLACVGGGSAGSAAEKLLRAPLCTDETQSGGRVGGDEVESAALQPLSLALRHRCKVTSTIGGEGKGASKRCTTQSVSPEAAVALRETVRMSPTPAVPHTLLHVHGPKASDAANTTVNPGKPPPQASTAPSWAAAPRSITVVPVIDGTAATLGAKWQCPSRNWLSA